MMTPSITVALRTVYYDSDTEADRDKDIALATPLLSVYSSAEQAAQKELGLEIMEGDLYFFAVDGTPLKAHFTKEAYVADKKYFRGEYFLQSASGTTLLETLTERLKCNPSPHAHIVINQSVTDEAAQQYGWQTAAAMQQGIEKALAILTPDMAMRVVFDKISAWR